MLWFFSNFSQAFGSSVQLDVYEKADRIGGRMRVLELNGEEMEAGGAVVHDSNKYMKYFTKEMGELQFIRTPRCHTTYKSNNINFTRSLNLM